jgi:hypothetical protein
MSAARGVQVPAVAGFERRISSKGRAGNRM